MLRALLVALGALVAWRFLARRSAPNEIVVVGWADGSTIELDPGSPERDALAEIARGVLG
jgi:hypothetical protein